MKQNSSERKIHELKTPLNLSDILNLKVNDIVYITGKIYTARDESHRRIIEYDRTEKDIPFNLKGSVIYHCGPVMQKTEKKEAWKAVAAGPTTSDRMTQMTPSILEKHEIRAIIGKGGMECLGDVMKRNKCVYLSYTGGCAALAADMIQSVSNLYWEDLGMAEAVWELNVGRFGPLIVAIDSTGTDLFMNVKRRAMRIYDNL